MKGIASLAVLLALAVSAQAAHSGNYTRYTATINTCNVISADVKADTYGYITLDWDESKMCWMGSLTLHNLVDFTMAHLHLGSPTEEGEVLAWVWPSETMMPTMQPLTSPLLSLKFEFANETMDLTPVAGTFAQLKTYLDNGMVYLNVHTVEYPNGVARGNMLLRGTYLTYDNEYDTCEAYPHHHHDDDMSDGGSGMYGGARRMSRKVMRML